LSQTEDEQNVAENTINIRREKATGYSREYGQSCLSCLGPTFFHYKRKAGIYTSNSCCFLISSVIFGVIGTIGGALITGYAIINNASGGFASMSEIKWGLIIGAGVGLVLGVFAAAWMVKIMAQEELQDEQDTYEDYLSIKNTFNQI
jgi:hypothetical protein